LRSSAEGTRLQKAIIQRVIQMDKFVLSLVSINNSNNLGTKKLLKNERKMSF
jgi:hypothetical protein